MYVVTSYRSVYGINLINFEFMLLEIFDSKNLGLLTESRTSELIISLAGYDV